MTRKNVHGAKAGRNGEDIERGKRCPCPDQYRDIREMVRRECDQKKDD